jgi:hypothetical protein
VTQWTPRTLICRLSRRLSLLKCQDLIEPFGQLHCRLTSTWCRSRRTARFRHC